MQLLSAYVSVGGDDLNVVVREYDTAITFPEMLILKALHGPESVRRITDVGDVDRDPDEERARLQSIYGGAVIQMVFPGSHTPLPTEDPRRSRVRPETAAVEDPFDNRKTKR